MRQALTKAAIAVIYIASATGSSLLAQTSNPQQKGSTKVFGLPVAKTDSTAPAGSTAAAVENRSNTANAANATKTSEAKFPTNWGAVAKIYVAIEGTKQGKFKGTAQRGVNPGFECLTYLLQQQPGAGHKPEIVITKGSDAATNQLLQALETGEPLRAVVFEFVGEGGKGVSKATLTGASIVAIQQHFDAKTRGVFEDITLNFTKIDYTE